MRIHCFSTGVVRLKPGDSGLGRYFAGAWRDDTLPVNAFLIEHPAGLCLFDTGQTALAAEQGYFPGWYPFFRLARFELGPKDEVAAQVARLGFEPSQVRWVVLSHLHTDHVGGLTPFTGSQVLATRLEWQRATGVGGRLRGYLPQYWPEAITPVLVDFKDPALGPFPGSYNLAGDGRLVLVPTPGHTPGHMSLLVRTDGARYLLAGDLVHAAANLPAAAPEIARFCSETNTTVLTTHAPVAGLIGGGDTDDRLVYRSSPLLPEEV